MFDRWQYRFMVGYYWLVEWIQARFTPAGKLVLAGLLISAPMAATPNQTLAYQIFVLLLLLLLFSFACSCFFSVRLRVQRRLPPMVTVGQPVAYPCTVENPTATPQAGLTFIEKFKDTRPAFETFIAIKPPPSAGNSRINRIMEQDKARIRSFKRKPVDRKDHVLPTLPAGKKTEVALSFTPLERGYLRLKGLTFHCADPLGLYRAAVNLPAEESLLVLPRMYPTRLLQLADSRKYNQRGVSLASHIGESEEFVGLRDYRPGDPLRHIHWHSWAKTGNPMVKQYQDEYFSRHALILDTFTLYDSEVFEEAVSVAASFSANIDLADSLLDLMFVGTESYCFTAGRSLSHTDQILEILATVKKCTDHPFRVLKDLVLSRSSLLSGSICVFLDWDEERQSLVSRLRAQNIPLLVIVVREPGAAGDLDPGPMKDQADRFHVLEAGQIEEGLRRV